MKIVDYKKFLRSVVLVLIILFILSMVCAKASWSHKKIEYKSIYVSKGDTLWSIAKDLQKNNEYYRNKDLRDIIISIKTINNLETSNIFIDQELVIPIG